MTFLALPLCHRGRQLQLGKYAIQHGTVECRGCRPVGGGEAIHRNTDLEARTAKIRIQYFDSALVHLDEFLGDGKPQAGAGCFAVDAAVALAEAFENRLTQLRLHAGTGVVNLKKQLA